MLQDVALGDKSLADYTHLVGRGLVEEIRSLAEPLKGKRVLHISATAFGGGVSEILYTLVPLMRDVGLDAEWQVIYGREEFFNATKLMHNALQGSPQDLTEEQSPTWVWQCHIDLSTPNAETLGRLLPHLERYPTSLFHLHQYIPGGMNGRVHSIPPAIDPLAPKNMALSPDDAVYVCNQFGLDVDRPLVCQVSRFDPWKDPLGVIDAYRIVKEEFPDVQLTLVGSMATDDPEGWDFFNATIA